jgi:hypothetical protein
MLSGIVIFLNVLFLALGFALPMSDFIQEYSEIVCTISLMFSFAILVIPVFRKKKTILIALWAIHIIQALLLTHVYDTHAIYIYAISLVKSITYVIVGFIVYFLYSFSISNHNEEKDEHKE